MSTAQSLVTARIGNIDLGKFSGRTGGETTAEISKHRPGGMAPADAYPGFTETGDVTLTRAYKKDGSDLELIRRVRPLVGSGEVVTLSEQPLDSMGVPFGRPTVWSGLLAGLAPGDYDAQSNEPRAFELTVSVVEVA